MGRWVGGWWFNGWGVVGGGGLGRVALIKGPGSFDFLLLTKVRVCFLMFVNVFFNHVLNLHFGRFRPIWESFCTPFSIMIFD